MALASETRWKASSLCFRRRFFQVLRFWKICQSCDSDFSLSAAEKHSVNKSQRWQLSLRGLVTTTHYLTSSVARFGQISPLWWNLTCLVIFKVNIVLSTILNQLWQYIMLLGKFSLLQIAKYCTNNITIWSHWVSKCLQSWSRYSALTSCQSGSSSPDLGLGWIKASSFAFFTSSTIIWNLKVFRCIGLI